jgi:hypothetical protein
VKGDGKGPSLVVDPNVPSLAPWLAYGSCKTVWIDNAVHRKEKTGRDDHYWTDLEERECMGALAAVYAELRTKGRASKDPVLERIHDIVADGFVEEFVLYEMASRIDPHFMLKVGEEARLRMREYIGRHVIVMRGDT